MTDYLFTGESLAHVEDEWLVEINDGTDEESLAHFSVTLTVGHRWGDHATISLSSLFDEDMETQSVSEQFNQALGSLDRLKKTIQQAIDKTLEAQNDFFLGKRRS